MNTMNNDPSMNPGAMVPAMQEVAAGMTRREMLGNVFKGLGVVAGGYAAYRLGSNVLGTTDSADADTAPDPCKSMVIVDIDQDGNRGYFVKANHTPTELIAIIEKIMSES